MLRLLVPLLLLRLLWRSRGNAGYRAQIWHRIGLYGRHRPALARERVWVHAVSVGETLAIIPLIERLLAERPEARVLITSTTPTGAEQVRQKLGDRVDWDWVPFDTPGAVRRFFAHWHPTIGVLVETEIWPNLVTHAAARGVPMVLLNARLSKRSARGYARVAGVTRPTLACLSGVAAQGRADARRLRTLGVNPDVLTVTGNLKFAIDTDALHRANEREWSALGPGLADRPVWLAASTHPGEEEQVLKAFSVLKTERPEAFLMLAPRHPDRVANVLALPEMDQFRVVLHSTFAASQTASEKTAQSAVGQAVCDRDDVLVVDTLGHLGALTGCADLVFVGGSLVPHGGHNPLEAAAWRLPILTGGHVFNFSGIYRDLISRGAAMEVETSTLPAVLLNCLGEHAEAAQIKAMGARAGEYQSAQGGVLEGQWAVLTAHLHLA